MKFIKSLFKKRKPHMTEFSKWVVRMFIYLFVITFVYGIIMVTAEFIVASQQDGYNQMPVHLPELFDYIKSAVIVAASYICAAAFLNREKVIKGYDPHYDDKFKSQSPDDAP